MNAVIRDWAPVNDRSGTVRVIAGRKPTLICYVYLIWNPVFIFSNLRESFAFLSLFMYIVSSATFMYYYVVKLFGVLKFLFGYLDNSAQSDVSLMYCVLRRFTSLFRTCQVVWMETWICIEKPQWAPSVFFLKKKNTSVLFFFLCPICSECSTHWTRQRAILLTSCIFLFNQSHSRPLSRWVFQNKRISKISNSHKCTNNAEHEDWEIKITDSSATPTSDATEDIFLKTFK